MTRLFAGFAEQVRGPGSLLAALPQGGAQSLPIPTAPPHWGSGGGAHGATHHPTAHLDAGAGEKLVKTKARG